MRLLLIRHGESEHGLRGQIADVRACTGLTPKGQQQARALAERLSASGELRPGAHFLTSPVLRARQTAEILAEASPLGQAAEDGNLREILPGDAEGLTGEEYRARYGAFDLIAAPDRPFAPGGESWNAFVDRVRTTLHNYAERFAGQRVVAVSHAGFIVAALLVIFDIPRPGTGAQFDPLHSSITEWQVSGGIWRLVRYNDVAHLIGVDG